MTWARDIPPRQRDIVSILPGGSLSNYSPGFFIQSMSVDNNSGSWLFVETLHQWVPPYTLGWTRNLDWQTRAVSIASRTGPNGLVSTSAGEDVVVTLSDGHVPSPSNGVSYVNKSGQPEGVLTYYNNVLAGETYNTITVPTGVTATTRVRLFRATALLHSADPANVPRPSLPIRNVFVRIATSGVALSSNFPGFMVVTYNNPIDRIVWTPPLDLPLGKPLVFDYIILGSTGGVDTQDWSMHLIFGVI